MGLSIRTIMLAFIIIVLTCQTICCSTVITQQLIGFWNDQFPVSAGLYGYVLLENGSFYYTRRPKTVKDRYEGSVGKWKLQGKNILIDITYNLKWKNDLIIHKSYGLDPGDDNIFYAEKDNSSKWFLISDTNTLINNSGQKPSKILIKPIYNGKLQTKPEVYWRITNKPLDSIDIKYIVDFYDKTIKSMKG